MTSVEYIGTCVPDALARWFGSYGSLALVTRALAITVPEHPALTTVTAASAQSPRLIGLAASARVHGATATANAVTALLASLVELLGRLIGDDLALMLLEPCASREVERGDPRANGRPPMAAGPRMVAMPDAVFLPDARPLDTDAPHSTDES